MLLDNFTSPLPARKLNVSVTGPSIFKISAGVVFGLLLERMSRLAKQVFLLLIDKLFSISLLNDDSLAIEEPEFIEKSVTTSPTQSQAP